MTLLDWAIVLILNGSVIGYGFWLARGTSTSSEWFLGNRMLPWWAIGLSMFATNVDSADLVGVTASSYKEGVHIITVYALGSALGGILAAFLLVPTMARMGLYTNAEYLESRFGPGTRALSALIQLQYRSSMLGLMIWSVYKLLTNLIELPPATSWVIIILMVLGSGIYTAWGGLKTVVWTDAAQGILMLVGGLVIFVTVWQAAGGWSEMRETLAQQVTDDGGTREDMLHIGRHTTDNGATPAIWTAIGWCIIGGGYWTVNHTQTMRLMGARSIWDMKMAAVLGVGASLPIMIACSCLGLFGRALPGYENLQDADSLFPLLARQYLQPGFKGLVAAGIVAAAVSTFDSMGSALSAIFTRDIYARLIVRRADDAHYVLVGRIATVGVLVLGFLYLPFIRQQDHMIRAFTTLIPIFVTPLFCIYVVGATTSASRHSGWAGLTTGSIYGLIAFVDRDVKDFASIPFWFSGRWVALPWSVLFTCLGIIAVTLVTGTYRPRADIPHKEQGWLDRSRLALTPLPTHPFVSACPIWLSPSLWAVILVAVSVFIVAWFW